MDNLIAEQLSKMNIGYDFLTNIRSKDGVSVYRVVCGGKSYVIWFKY